MAKNQALFYLILFSFIQFFFLPVLLFSSCIIPTKPNKQFFKWDLFVVLFECIRKIQQNS